jgi:hypothetical protein
MSPGTCPFSKGRPILATIENTEAIGFDPRSLAWSYIGRREAKDGCCASPVLWASRLGFPRDRQVAGTTRQVKNGIRITVAPFRPSNKGTGFFSWNRQWPVCPIPFRWLSLLPAFHSLCAGISG